MAHVVSGIRDDSSAANRHPAMTWNAEADAKVHTHTAITHTVSEH